MTPELKEQILELLKESLTVKISSEFTTGWGSGIFYNIELRLDGEVISSDSIRVSN